MNIAMIRQQILNRFIKTGVKNIIDLGAGDGKMSNYLVNHGCNVTAVDINFQPEMVNPHKYRMVCGDITDLQKFDQSFDGVLASHCLEHVYNPLNTLLEWRNVIKKDGYLCIIVPPFVHRVVGRHLFIGWNIGHLMLLLLRTGFNIMNGKFIKYDYNVAAIVQKTDDILGTSINEEVLVRYSHMFPLSIAKEIKANMITNSWGEQISFFNGDITQLNWG